MFPLTSLQCISFINKNLFLLSQHFISIIFNLQIVYSSTAKDTFPPKAYPLPRLNIHLLSNILSIFYTSPYPALFQVNLLLNLHILQLSQNLLRTHWLLPKMILVPNHATTTLHNAQRIDPASKTPDSCQLTSGRTKRINASRQKAYLLRDMRIISEREERERAAKTGRTTFASFTRSAFQQSKLRLFFY